MEDSPFIPGHINKDTSNFQKEKRKIFSVIGFYGPEQYIANTTSEHINRRYRGAFTLTWPAGVIFGDDTDIKFEYFVDGNLVTIYVPDTGTNGNGGGGASEQSPDIDDALDITPKNPYSGSIRCYNGSVIPGIITIKEVEVNPGEFKTRFEIVPNAAFQAGLNSFGPGQFTYIRKNKT